MDPLSIEGALMFTPCVHADDLDIFLERFRAGELGGYSVIRRTSRKRVLRGVHFADVPPGLAKYVSCVSGAILGVIVDLRVGSLGYGRWEAVRLDEQSRRAVVLSEGLGGAFVVLAELAIALYLCSTPYAPSRKHGVHPLDPGLGISWPQDVQPVLSEKDAAAPSLEEARAARLSPPLVSC